MFPVQMEVLKKIIKALEFSSFLKRFLNTPFLSLTKVISRKFILHLSVAVAGSSFQVCWHCTSPCPTNGVPYCWWFRNPSVAPVEVGSLSHELLRKKLLEFPTGGCQNQENNFSFGCSNFPTLKTHSQWREWKSWDSRQFLPSSKTGATSFIIPWTSHRRRLYVHVYIYSVSSKISYIIYHISFILQVDSFISPKSCWTSQEFTQSEKETAQNNNTFAATYNSSSSKWAQKILKTKT